MNIYIESATFTTDTIPNDAEKGLNQLIGKSFDLRKVTDRVERHYLTRALKLAHYNKTRTAQLLGLPNYQMLTRIAMRLGVSLKESE